jgi:hypothetical protein
VSVVRWWTVQLLTSSSTRAYRMKLKEWGFMRHKPRKTSGKTTNRDERSPSVSQHGDEEDRSERDSSTTVEPMSIDLPSIEPLLVESSRRKSTRWQILPDVDLVQVEPSFMGMLHRAPT